MIWVVVAGLMFLAIVWISVHWCIAAGCYLIRLPSHSPGLSARGAILPATLVAAFTVGWWILSWYLGSQVFSEFLLWVLASLFFSVLLGAPWGLHTAGIEWNQAWGAAAVGAGLLFLLVGIIVVIFKYFVAFA